VWPTTSMVEHYSLLAVECSLSARANRMGDEFPSSSLQPHCTKSAVKLLPINQSGLWPQLGPMQISGMALWLGRRSLAGGLSLPCCTRSVVDSNPANSAFHPCWVSKCKCVVIHVFTCITQVDTFNNGRLLLYGCTTQNP